MSIPSARPSHGRQKTKPSARTRSRAKKTVAAEKLASVLLRFFAEHPQGAAVSITVRGKQFVVEPQKPVAVTRGRFLPIAPIDYFARFYTPELAAEDNRLAAHSAHDPADFIE